MPTPPDDEDSLRHQIESLEAECGCALGARFLVAAILLYLVIWHFLLRPIIPSMWLAVPMGVAVSLLAVGVGKFTGILMARFRARRLKARLEQHRNRSRHA